MSKIIRSNRVNLSEGSYKLSSDVFINKEDYISNDENESANEEHDVDSASEKEIDESSEEKEKEDSYNAESLIEQAEKAALEIMDNAQVHADKLIEDARESARNLETEAMENANAAYENAKEKGRAEAYEEVYEEAFKQGKEEADLLIEKAKKELDEALEIKRQLHIKNEEFLIGKEQELIEMVLAISKKVIAKEVEDVEYIEVLIGEAMKHLNYANDIVLRVSERDFEAAKLAKPKILAMAERIENLEIKIDYSLSPASCVIDTNSGSIDASVKTQIERIEEIFRDILTAQQSAYIDEE